MDVVESGPQGSGRGGWVVGGVAALALVAGLLRAAGDASPSAEPSASPTPTPTPTVTFDSYAGSGNPEPEASPGPTSIFTRQWSGPRDPLLLALDSGLRRDAGNGTPPAEIAAGTSPAVRLLPVTGGTAVLEASGDHVAGPAVAVSFLAEGSRDAVRLGTAYDAVPAAEQGSLWLVDGPAGEPGARMTMRRVSVRTGRVRQRVTLPAGTQPVAGVATGIVLRSTDGARPTDDWVWSPRTGAVVRRLGGVALDTTARRVVVRDMTLCLRRCTRVLDVVDGTSAPVDGLDGVMHGPALSPDGAWVAAYCEMGDDRMQLLVAAVGSDETTVVGDSELGWEMQAMFAWSRDSQRLYVSVQAADGDGQVVGWDIGSQQLGVVLDEGVHALAAE